MDGLVPLAQVRSLHSPGTRERMLARRRGTRTNFLHSTRAAQQPEQIDMMLFKRRLSSPAFCRLFKVGSVIAAPVVVSRSESSLSSMSANLLMVGVAPFGAFAVATFGSLAAAGARSVAPAAAIGASRCGTSPAITAAGVRSVPRQAALGASRCGAPVASTLAEGAGFAPLAFSAKIGLSA